MDSFPVLRRQTQNKIRSNLQRMDNEQNKNPADLKLSKCIPSIQHSENKAPAECAQNPPIQQGISKIPVLAKTLCLQTSSGFKQSYKKWEEKTLPGKVKEKRQLTRPVPFNLSNRKKTQRAVEVHKSLTASQSKAQVSNTLKSHLSSVPGKTVQNEGSSAQPGPGAEVALDNMNLLSLKEPSKSSIAELLMVKSASSKALNDKKENVQQDHTALLGVQVFTPKSKPCNDLPQRVSVKKSQRKAGPLAGPLRSVQFSPDSDALQSILQNKGVKAGGPLGDMSRDSICPSNRGTSIYSAQRVPLKKNKAETNGGPLAVKETTVTKGTPQRVRNTKHLPMSMKIYQKPHIKPGSRNLKVNLQKLFDMDDEGTAGPGKDPETQPEQFSEQATAKATCTKPAEMCRTKIDDIVDEPKTLPAQPRESVIMFSSKKLLRVPSFDLEVSAPLHQVSSDKRNLSEARSETSADPAPHSHLSALHLHRDLTNQKTSSPSSSVVMLRKLIPSLEELRLDDEVSTYTSKSVNAAPRFLPPRCENPLASFLQFEESTRFIPIGFDCPPSLHNSQQNTR